MRVPPRSCPRNERTGAALVVLLLAFALIGAMTTTVAWQMTASHRMLNRREQELQAGWLARAGAEIAIARLLSNPENYHGESLEIIPGGEVRIAVQPKAKSNDQFRVESEGRYPANGSEPACRTVVCCAKRLTDGGKVTIRILSFEK
jgi:hypothetical protein